MPQEQKKPNSPRTRKCEVRFEPSTLRVQVDSGTLLLDAAHKAGIYVTSICGGDGYCGKCKLVVDQGRFKAMPTTLLTQDELHENVVLACRTKILSDMVVTVPKTHGLQTEHILTDTDTERFSQLAGKTESGLFRFDPLVRRIYLEMSPPSVHDHTADHERLYLAIREQVDAPIMQTGYRVIQNLPRVLSESDYKATATIGRRGGTTEVIDVIAGDHSKTGFAVAVDLGTTTVVAHLVNLADGTTIDSEATYNSQINFGEDYIRRIIYAEQNNAFDEMQSRIVSDVNSLIMTLASRQQMDLQDVEAIVCSGNTAMIHFLLNIDATRIRRDPYVGSVNFMPPIRAAEVGVKVDKRGLLYCLPGVSAYVGSDVVAGVLATRLYTRDRVCLFIDIGTNGEVVLGNKDWLVCASSSAGPAFEGSGVKHGMRAGAGAIEKLEILPDGTVQYKTIGEKHPTGICGSGLLDTLAELFTRSVIDRTGRLVPGSYGRVAEADEGLQYELVAGNDGHQQIVITQADIDNLIRSKAGVFAAIKVLMESTQTAAENLDAIFIAGGFGNFMNVKQAVTIGMLPDVPLEKIQFAGNTSIAGAKMVLLSREALEAAERIASNMTYFDLMNHPTYMEEFIKAKFLPHTDLSLFPSVHCNAVSNAAKP